jgi:hypothetical protein
VSSTRFKPTQNVVDERPRTCWLLKGESRHDKKYEELILPTPNVCHILNQDEKQRLSVRCNLLDVGGLTAAFTDVRAKIFLLRPEKRAAIRVHPEKKPSAAPTRLGNTYKRYG